MSDLLDFAAKLRLYADAVGLMLLPIGAALAIWFWRKQREAKR